MDGISSRHGGHHVAQKLMNTTLPRRLESCQVLPCKSTRVKSGAGLFNSATVTTGSLSLLQPAIRIKMMQNRK